MSIKSFYSTKGPAKEYTNGDAKRVLSKPTNLPNPNNKATTRKKK